MKIVVFENDFVDFAAVFSESFKSKLIKSLIIVSRTESYIRKFASDIDVIDYSELKTDVRGSVRDVEADYMRQLKPTFASAFENEGDILFVMTCGTTELAAFPVLQQVCNEKRLRSHFLFIAPFLFQGEKQAEDMRTLLKMPDENYSSVSLYYPDELLNLEEFHKEKSGEGAEPLPDEIYSVRNAYDALEHAVCGVAQDMYLQIPWLIRSMQYTYDFRKRQFSLAVDPLHLVLSMWYGVIREEFEEAEPEVNGGDELRSAAEVLRQAIGMHSAKQRKKDVSEEYENKGILDPERKKKKSAYNNIAANSIPLSAYRAQINERTISSITERIKQMIYGEDERDPEARKRSQERLIREIRKFQIRQAEAEEKFGGDPPTVVLNNIEALAEVYMNDGSEANKEGNTAMRPYGSTPYQRAAWAASQKELSNSWPDIIRQDPQQKG